MRVLHGDALTRLRTEQPGRAHVDGRIRLSELLVVGGAHRIDEMRHVEAPDHRLDQLMTRRRSDADPQTDLTRRVHRLDGARQRHTFVAHMVDHGAHDLALNGPRADAIPRPGAIPEVDNFLDAHAPGLAQLRVRELDAHATEHVTFDAAPYGLRVDQHSVHIEHARFDHVCPLPGAAAR